MMIIRCTGKLQKEMGLKKNDLETVEPQFSYLGSWHANLLHIDGKKCVLFTNDKTLFSFIAPGVTRAQIKNLSELFIDLFQCVLADEGFSKIIVGKILSEYSEVTYSKTNSKSVLGSMNDLAFHYKFLILDSGGIDSPAIPGIIKQLNHMPMSAIEFTYAIDALRSMYNETLHIV